MDEQRGTVVSPTELATVRAELAETRRLLREREQLLAGEIQRRVRGALAVVRSVFARTAETSDTLEDASHHFRGRLDVIARHQFPHPSVNDLERLIRDEFRDFRFGYEDAIAIGGPEVDLLPEEVLPLALTLHELVTNALKFGALAGDGQVRVTWTIDADALALTWTETGVRVIAPAPLRRGFGREFIEDALPFQIGAETAFALRPGGVLCTIRLPRGTGDAPGGGFGRNR